MTQPNSSPNHPSFPSWIIWIILVVVILVGAVLVSNRIGYQQGVSYVPPTATNDIPGLIRAAQERQLGGTQVPSVNGTIATAVPSSHFADAEPVQAGEFYAFYGIPEEAERVETTTYDNATYAGANYTNTTGKGTKAYLAEPGVLLHQPGGLTKAEEKAAGAAANEISPLTQRPMDVLGATYQQDCPEGQWLFLTLSQINVETPNFRLELDWQEKTTYFVVIRCRYQDGTKDTAKAERVLLSNYIAGANNPMVYPFGSFISHDHFWQLVKTAHTNNNCGGRQSCSNVYSVYLDLNTGAASVTHIDSNDKVTLIYANYKS